MAHKLFCLILIRIATFHTRLELLFITIVFPNLISFAYKFIQQNYSQFLLHWKLFSAILKVFVQTEIIHSEVFVFSGWTAHAKNLVRQSVAIKKSWEVAVTVVLVIILSTSTQFRKFSERRLQFAYFLNFLTCGDSNNEKRQRPAKLQKFRGNLESTRHSSLEFRTRFQKCLLTTVWNNWENAKFDVNSRELLLFHRFHNLHHFFLVIRKKTNENFYQQKNSLAEHFLCKFPFIYSFY